MFPFDFDPIPRIEHCLLPTPLVPMDRLTEHLGKAKVYVKRDDLTGIALGGNKNRKLEFLLADAIQNGSDVILTEGAVTSNHCLQTAACTVRLGLECQLILSDSHIGDKSTGNLLLDQILDVEIHRVNDSSERKPKMEEIANNLTRLGKRPYIIPTGGSNSIGVLGYVNFMKEITEQSADLDLAFDYLIFPTGSSGTQAGIILGKKFFYPELNPLGISVGDDRLEIIRNIKAIISDFNKDWKLSLKISDSEIKVLDQYYGDGYGIPNLEDAYNDALSLTENELVGVTKKQRQIFWRPAFIQLNFKIMKNY